MDKDESKAKPLPTVWTKMNHTKRTSDLIRPTGCRGRDENAHSERWMDGSVRFMQNLWFGSLFRKLTVKWQLARWSYTQHFWRPRKMNELHKRRISPKSIWLYFYSAPPFLPDFRLATNQIDLANNSFFQKEEEERLSRKLSDHNQSKL